VVLLFQLDGQRSMPLLMVAQERLSYDRCIKISSTSTKTIKHIKKLSFILEIANKDFLKS